MPIAISVEKPSAAENVFISSRVDRSNQSNISMVTACSYSGTFLIEECTGRRAGPMEYVFTYLAIALLLDDIFCYIPNFGIGVYSS